MHDHRPGEVVEFRAEAALEPGLDNEGAVPGDALEEGIDEADDEEGGRELRVEARAFGDAARDDGRNRGGEGEQEEELGQAVAVVFGQDFGAAEEVDTVGDAVADEEIGQRRYREIDQDLDQGVDLVFLAHGAELEKGEAGVHGKDHDGAEQDEKYVGRRMWLFQDGAPKVVPHTCGERATFKSNNHSKLVPLFESMAWPCLCGGLAPSWCRLDPA